VRTVLCDRLGIDHPILNAPMGAGSATAELAAAVSGAGGLGLIGGSLIGLGDLSDGIRRAGGLTDGPIGVGFITHLPDTAERQRLALDHGVRVVTHSFADPTPFVAEAHDAGGLVISQVRTVDEAERSAEGGADVVVAQGTEAGGHTGLVSTLPLVPAVVDAVAPLPVVAAGGIADARGIAAALVLGAEGVWMGTRFLATPEASMSTAKKERILTAVPSDTVLTDVFDIAGGLTFPPDVHTRVIRNQFTDRWHGHEDEIPGWSDEQRNQFFADVFVDPDRGLLAAGEAAGLVHEIEPAGALVARLAAEVDALLRERSADLTG